jgi:glycosyltransferase involved in cell wall biosynthesis
MKKVLFVATVVKTHIMEFHIPYLKMLKELGWETSVAARNDYENLADCSIPYCDHYFNIPFERSPFSSKNRDALKQLKRIIDKNHYDVVYCHTPVGGVLARVASKDARKRGTKVFYTAHGFHFFDGAPLQNWLLFYPVEKHLSRYTDVLFTINWEDYHRANDHFFAKKVVHLPGIGVDVGKFKPSENDQIIRKLKRKELGVQSDEIMLLNVAELAGRKNQKVIIEAMKQVKNQKVKLFIAGQGALKDELTDLIERLGLKDRVTLLGYRDDVRDLYKAADIFIFPSQREGFGIAAIEAMASGLPIITSNVNGIKEYSEDGVTGFVNDFKDAGGFARSIDKLAGNKQLCQKMGEYNNEKAREYSIDKPVAIVRKEFEALM